MKPKSTHHVLMLELLFTAASVIGVARRRWRWRGVRIIDELSCSTLRWVVVVVLGMMVVVVV